MPVQYRVTVCAEHLSHHLTASVSFSSATGVSHGPAPLVPATSARPAAGAPPGGSGAFSAKTHEAVCEEFGLRAPASAGRLTSLTLSTAGDIPSFSLGRALAGASADWRVRWVAVEEDLPAPLRVSSASSHGGTDAEKRLQRTQHAHRAAVRAREAEDDESGEDEEGSEPASSPRSAHSGRGGAPAAPPLPGALTRTYFFVVDKARRGAPRSRVRKLFQSCSRFFRRRLSCPSRRWWRLVRR